MVKRSDLGVAEKVGQTRGRSDGACYDARCDQPGGCARRYRRSGNPIAEVGEQCRDEQSDRKRHEHRMKRMAPDRREDCDARLFVRRSMPGSMVARLGIAIRTIVSGVSMFPPMGVRAVS